MTKQRRALKKNRGVAVLLALFFMILLSMIGLALINMVPVELRSSTRTRLDVQAHYAVTSGIRHARAWCSAVMTPTTDPNNPDFLGDDPTTTGNSFYAPGGSYLNEITGVNGAVPAVEYMPMRLQEVFGSGLIPTNTSKWTNSHSMLNLPNSGPTAVDGQTVVLVKKAPLVLDDWQTYVVIIPDANTPGGINTQSGGQITGQFGGAGAAGRRCYQFVSIGFYQGFPALRGKSTVLEDSFARYSLFVDQDPSQSWALQALAGKVTTLGPVHTNQSFKFAVDPGVWGSTSATKPFNGLLTFAKYATEAETSVDAALNHDGVVYSNGNERSGASESNRPFNAAGAEIADRYSRLISGGRSNLRQTAPVQLPPDSTKLANAAYGTNFLTSPYETGTLASHIAPGGQPDGMFVFPNTSNKAAGGVVVKDDQQRMFLEVVDNNGLPITNVAGLENGTQSGNPALRTQGQPRQREVVSTQTVTSTSTVTSVVTTGSTTGTSVGTTSSRITTGSTTFVTSGPSVSTITTGSTLIPRTTVRPLTTVTTTTRTTSTRSTTFNTTTSTTTVGGAGGIVQTATITVPVSFWVTFTTTGVSTQTTGSTTLTTGTSTRWLTSRSTTTTTRTTTRPLTTWVTTFGTVTTTLPLTTRVTSVSTGVFTNVNTSTETFRPIDQVIEARNLPVNLNASMFSSLTPGQLNNYRTPAGATGTGSNMDVSKLTGITELLLSSGGTLSPISATSVPSGNVVVIKQSRANPQQAVVFIFPADANDEGALLNGAVLAEGHLGDPGNPAGGQGGVGGVAGVNYGRKTIGGQIQSPSATNDASPFGRQPAAPSVTVGVENNLWQYGTKINEENAELLKAEHGLGLVAEEIRINATPGPFENFWDPNKGVNYATHQLLNIHAVLLGGSNSTGGLTIRGFQDVNQITPGNMGAPANQTPYIRFVGGLILRNYYARINGFTGAGWNSMNVYNQQLALKPPPYFPNNGLLLPLSYVEERIWSEQQL